MSEKQPKDKQIVVVRPDTGEISFCILGITPLIVNRMAEKAKRELLMPKGRKTAADKATSLKHDPKDEFLHSPYINSDPKSPTLLLALSTWFKQGMCNAALDVPGAQKTQIGRLCWFDVERVALYGTPQLKMDVVRCADMNKTPDVRTRCILPRWACCVTFGFIKPSLNETSLTNLLVFAGQSQGAADWRVGKGSGNYGRYTVASQNDPAYLAVLKEGRKVQATALDDPSFYDEESQELYDWFCREVKTRGKEESVNSNGRVKHRGLLKQEG